VKHSFKIILQIFILLIIPFSGFAQKAKNFDLMKDNIESMIPPLETLIDSAISNNPYVKYRDLQISVNKNKLQADRSEWTRNLGVQIDSRYGTFDNFSTNTSEGQNPSLLATRSNQLNYGAGAYIKFPIYDIVNRKNQINLSKSEVQQAVNMAEVQRNELRQLVIRQYNDLILRQKLLRSKSKYIETVKINMEMADKEFQNGVIPVGEYSRISEIVSRAEVDFETAKTDYNTAYMILEELVGYKFNLNNTVNIINESH